MKNKIGIKGKIGIVLLFVVLLGGIYALNNTVFADTSQFYLYYKYQDGNLRLQDELLETNNIVIQMQTDGTLTTTDEIKWSVDDNTIIQIEPDASEKQTCKLTSLKPGTTVVRAQLIRTVDGQQVIYNADCQFTVKLAINDYTNTPYNLGKIVPLFDEKVDGNGSLLIEEGDTFDFLLKYGKAQKDELSWVSEDKSVATIDDNGRVTAVGAGVTKISVSTYDPSSIQQIDTIYVVVKSKFKEKANSSALDYVNYEDPTTLYTNASIASNLIWVVKDNDGKEIVNTYKGLTSPLVTLEPSSTDGTCTITSKAGYYSVEIYPQNRFDKSIHLYESDANYFTPGKANVTEYVRFNFPSVSVKIGDQFNLAACSNVYDLNNDFRIIVDNADYDTDSSIVTFTKEATVDIYITKKVNSKLPTKESAYTHSIECKYEAAIDSFNKTIFVGETIQLENISYPVDATLEYVSSDESIATVTIAGKVTGVKVGTCTVQAKVTTAEGIIKTTTWYITVSPTVTATLNPTEATINIGETLTIYATYKPSNLEYVDIIWKCSDESVLQIETDVTNKTSVNVKALKAGYATIVLQDKNKGELAFAKIYVREPITNIKLDKTSVSVVYDSSSSKNYFSLTTAITPKDPTDDTILWTSSNTDVATVDENGLVTYKKAGVATIRATPKYASSSSVYAECIVNVYQKITSLALSDSALTAQVGDTIKIVATYTPDQYILAEDKVITWTTSNSDVITVTGNGTFPSIKAVGVGNAVLTATTTSGQTKTCKITVLQDPTKIAFTSKNVSLNVGETTKLEYTLSPDKLTNSTVTWESMNTDYVTVDNAGRITAKAAGREGQSIVQIVARTSNGLSATINVTVTQPVTGLTLNTNKATVTKGKTFTLVPTITPDNAIDKNVTFRSDDTSIATVSATGVVTGIKNGTTIITVCSTNSGKEVYCVVTVTEKITSITLNRSSYYLGLKKSYKLVAKITSNYATNQKLKWTTSSKRVATVSSTGKVTGKKLGYATITAKATDGSGAKATCRVRVVRSVKSIKLNKSSAKIYEGKTLKLKATVSPSNATIKSVTWKSSNEKVAYVDANGLVNAVGVGKCTITATTKDSSGAKASCIIQVLEEKPTKSIDIVNKNITLIVGESETLKEITNPGKTSDSMKWYSDDTRIVSINKSTGKLTAKRTGTAKVTVVAESGKSATTTVTVVGLNKTKLSLEQYDTYKLKVLNGKSVQWDVDNPAVARVTSTGKVSARKVGSTYVTAIVNGRKIRCKVTVKKIK